MNWSALVGMKVAALRGFTQKKHTWGEAMHCPLAYILFDDGETFIELDEQSPYDYHDCCSSARNLELRVDAKRWQEMFNKEGSWNEPDNLACPF